MIANRALSERFTALFDRLNQGFFAGRLPRYRVSVRSRVPGLDGGGIHLRQRRLIVIRRWDDECLMMGTLVHEMAHAASNDWHGPRWRAVMDRLQEAGTPIQEVDLAPPMRLTRGMVLSSARDALSVDHGLTLRAYANRCAREFTGQPSGAAFLRSYPWI